MENSGENSVVNEQDQSEQTDQTVQQHEQQVPDSEPVKSIQIKKRPPVRHFISSPSSEISEVDNSDSDAEETNTASNSQVSVVCNKWPSIPRFIASKREPEVHSHQMRIDFVSQETKSRLWHTCWE